jgi:hypothetical protein
MDETPYDDAELERLGYSKEALSYQGDSHFLKALNQTPVTWSKHQGLLKNLQQNLTGVWNQGRQNIRTAYSDEATRLAYSSDAEGWNRIREYLKNQNPVISHPVDRIVEQL